MTIPVNPAQRGAYQRGYSACLLGLSRYANPYRETGWSATFAAAWFAGFDAADEVIERSDVLVGDPAYPEEVPA